MDGAPSNTDTARRWTSTYRRGHGNPAPSTKRCASRGVSRPGPAGLPGEHRKGSWRTALRSCPGS